MDYDEIETFKDLFIEALRINNFTTINLLLDKCPEIDFENINITHHYFDPEFKETLYPILAPICNNKILAMAQHIKLMSCVVFLMLIICLTSELSIFLPLICLLLGNIGQYETVRRQKKRQMIHSVESMSFSPIEYLIFKETQTYVSYRSDHNANELKNILTKLSKKNNLPFEKKSTLLFICMKHFRNDLLKTLL